MHEKDYKIMLVLVSTKPTAKQTHKGNEGDY